MHFEHGRRLTVADEMNDYTSWLQTGLDNHWIGPSVCATHDGIPTSHTEDDELDEHDPCLFIHRVYHDAMHAAEIRDNHTPTVWRDPRTT
jgi:hypothetical protein